MAIVVTRGSHNNLVTVFTMVMATLNCEMPVRIFLRDEAVVKFSKKKISEFNPSEVYAGLEATLQKNYETNGLMNLQKVIQDLKAQGDVKLYACTSSMALCGLAAEDLIAEIDEPRGLTSFLLEEMDDAGMILTF